MTDETDHPGEPAPPPEAEAPPEPPIAYQGAIDVAEPPTLSGWAISNRRTSAPITVEIAGRPPITVAADRPRPDLAEVVEAGDGGWTLDVAPLLRPGTNQLVLRLPDGQEMPGSPVAIVVPEGVDDAAEWVRYRGAIDIAELPTLSGWSLDNAGAAAAVTVEIAGKPLFTVAADEPRDDLLAQGLGKGAGGWHVDLVSLGIDAATVHLRFPNGRDLPGSPLRFGKPAHASAEHPPHVAATAADPAKKPLSLAELDEVSIDDLVDAVASGFIYVPPPEPPAEPEAPPPAAPEPAARVRRGLLSRLLGRR